MTNVCNQLRIQFVETDIKDFIDQSGGQSELLIGRLVHYLAIGSSDCFRSYIDTYNWTQAIQEYFPEFKEIMGFEL